MRGSDFRLGNYFYSALTLSVITGILPNKIAFKYVNEKDEQHAELDRFGLKFITIDGNWLSKLGFKKQDYNIYMLDNVFVYIPNDGKPELFILTPEYHEKIFLLNLDFLHELQNVYFYLKRKELVLKVKKRDSRDRYL